MNFELSFQKCSNSGVRTQVFELSVNSGSFKKIKQLKTSPMYWVKGLKNINKILRNC